MSILCRNIFRGISRIQSKVYFGALLRKYLTAFSRRLFLQKSSMVDVQLGSKYAADVFGGN